MSFRFSNQRYSLQANYQQTSINLFLRINVIFHVYSQQISQWDKLKCRLNPIKSVRLRHWRHSSHIFAQGAMCTSRVKINWTNIDWSYINIHLTFVHTSDYDFNHLQLSGNTVFFSSVCIRNTVSTESVLSPELIQKYCGQIKFTSSK